MRELLSIPSNYQVVFAHGGGQMQFSMVALNLIARKPSRKAVFVESGNFSERAIAETSRFGKTEVVATSRGTKYDRVPEFDVAAVDPEASYLHITTNNTIFGTQWHSFPKVNGVPLVGDATSEILSRPVDIPRFGVLYAGAQKNLGPSGMAVAIVRDDLLGHALPITPKILDYKQLAGDHSLTNTPNTFSVYVSMLVMKWIKDTGGVAAMEVRSKEKAALVYAALDRHKGFYHAHAHPAHRSLMNATFRLSSPELDDRFVAEGQAQGLYGVRGHRFVGGIRASLYNGMPVEGARALAAFMDEFARKNG
jgi:phosphoserine aminotransferase